MGEKKGKVCSLLTVRMCVVGRQINKTQPAQSKRNGQQCLLKKWSSEQVNDHIFSSPAISLSLLAEAEELLL